MRLYVLNIWTLLARGRSLADTNYYLRGVGASLRNFISRVFFSSVGSMDQRSFFPREFNS